MISLIFCGDLKYCPYIQRYIERLEAKNIKYEVVFWNRSSEKKEYPENYKYFELHSDLNKNKLSKVKDFLSFRRWLIDYLKHTECKKFVLLSTLSGVLIGNKLRKQQAKYIYDIRDYSYEHILPYYQKEKRVIKNSFRTVISSEGFRSFLPQKVDYIIAHNFNRKDIRKVEESVQLCGETKKIVWNGLIRYFDWQSEIMSALANDCRFELIYHGDGPELERFKEFCNTNKIKNVLFTGAYENAEKESLLENATVINNCYGYKNGEGKKLKYAISNKFYDGIIFRIPQIVEGGGYKAKLVDQYSIGIVINLKEDIKSQIINYLDQLDIEQFNKNCEDLLKKVIEEDDRYIELIDKFIECENE